jgi:hypothetical protein
MTRQFPHPHTTLPGHDPSKVRGADCITASASEALDVRLLKVAEKIADDARHIDDARPLTSGRLRVQAHILRAIAAEIRDAATPRRAVADSNDPIGNANTVTELRDAWATLAPPLDMEPHERIRLLEAALGRLLVIEARHEGNNR